MYHDHASRITRRAMLRGTALVLGGLALERPAWAEDDTRRPALRFGLVTDIHYADLPVSGTRYFRQTSTKLEEAVERFNREALSFVVELGDFIDHRSSDAQTAVERLGVIDATYRKLTCDRHYVIGNNCAAWLTQREIIDNCGAIASYYSFDVGQFHFVVIDSCYNRDGESFHFSQIGDRGARYYIPQSQLDWLADDLAKTHKPSIVLGHQPVARPNDSGSIRNFQQARQVLVDSGKVIAVLQGHIHRDEYTQIDGIHYCTFRSVVDGDGPQNNGYGIISLYDDASIRVEGFRRMGNRTLPRTESARR